MNNFSYIIVLIAGIALVLLGMDIRDKEAENQRISEAAVAQGVIDAEIEKSKSKWYINHDNDPKTKDYDIKMTAIGFDADNDEITYEWKQIAVNEFEKGSSVELLTYEGPVTYFTAKAGTYNFKVTATDSYGTSTMATQIVEIMPEPNTAPEVKIEVKNESKPEEPTDPFKGDKDKIMEFQEKNKLTVDGIWGKKSQEIYDALNKEDSAD